MLKEEVEQCQKEIESTTAGTATAALPEDEQSESVPEEEMENDNNSLEEPVAAPNDLDDDDLSLDYNLRR